MTLLQAIILSIIEGLTEFLPISSTGHLIIAERLLHIPPTDFSKTFSIVIQLTSILSVIWLYRTRLIHSITVWKQVIIAFIPTGIIGFLLYRIIKGFLLESITVTVYSLLIGGIVLLIVDSISKLNNGQKTIKKLTDTQLMGIGLIQSLSVIPGVSRSAASVVGGLLTGLSRKEAVEFSFLLAIPTMAAASGYDLIKSGIYFNSSEYLLLTVGCLFSFFSAMIAVRAFTIYVSKHNFTSFAVYRIILALILIMVYSF